MKRALLIAATALLVLAGCGASHPKQPTSLTARVQADDWFDGQNLMVKCALARHSCSMSWNASLYRTRSNWPTVLAEVSEFEDSFPNVRNLRIRLEDPRTRRVTSFTCVVRHTFKPGSYPWPCVETVRAPGSTSAMTIPSGPGV